MPEKILIVFPGVLYPVVGMSQVRTLEQVERLAADFITDVAVMCRDQQSYDAHVGYLKGKCNQVFRLPHPKFSKGKLFRIYRTLLYKLKYRLTGIPVEYTVSSHREVLNGIKKLVHDHDYRLMIVHYWFPAKVFPQLPPSLLKAIDTHYVVQENMEILEKGEYRHARTSLLKKEYEFSLTTQNRYFKNADILIFNSASQKPHIEKLFPEKKLIVTTNGQKLEQYLDYPSRKPDRNIIFYGALSNQFNGKALKVVIEDLLPR